MKTIVLSVALLAGCTVGASVDLEKSPKRLDCKDIRDGERFSFRPVDVTDVRVGYGGADSCFTVLDSSGRERRMCASMESYIKCEKVW